MSSGTATPPPPPAAAKPKPNAAPSEAFIEDRLRRTRRQVKGVDLASGLLTLAVGAVAYLLAAAVIDHWVIAGGLMPWARWLLFLGLLGGAGYYFAGRIVVPMIHRINPIFAAHTIEQSRPTLKNSLINFLLLRGHRRQLPEAVYRAVEQRAAADLSQVEIEAAVDRTHVIRRGYVLVGAVAAFALYLVLSSKSPLASAARVLCPWSDRAAPTRVTLLGVKPGDTTAFHGEFVAVSAEMSGVEPGEAVSVYYSTADGRSLDQKVPMALTDGGYRQHFECKLPAERLGLQQDVYYYITAGDCRAPQFGTFHIEVVAAPAILVEAIEYDYPPYTGLADRIVRRRGDIRAIEGTEVTIRAAANQVIKWAKIDLGCNGRHELNMDPSRKKATGRFTLRLDRDNSALPEHDRYQLRFRDAAGRLNPRPIRHQIEVIRDLPPKIHLLDPPQEEVQLAEDGRLEIRVDAVDPDFALRKVVLRAECGGRNLLIPPMLDTLHQGEFRGTYVFEPTRARLEGGPADPAATGLKAGDRVRYWAEAEDNKQPAPGRSVTAQQWITIVKPEPVEPPKGQPGDAGQEGQQEGGQEGQDRAGGDQRRPTPEQPDEARPPQEDRPPDQTGKPKAGEQDAPQKDGSQDQGQQQGASEENHPGEGEETPQPGDGSGAAQPGAGSQTQRRPGDGQGERPGEPIDPETQPGDAFERILKHREQQERPAGEQPGRQRQSGQQPPVEQGPGGQQPPDSGSPEQKAADRPIGGREPDEGPTAAQPASDQRPGDRQSDEAQRDGTEERQQPVGPPKEGTSRPAVGDGPTQNGGQSQTGPQEPGNAESPDQQGGKQPADGQRDAPQQSPGAGKPSNDQGGSPAAQGPNQPRQKKVGQPGQAPGQEQQPAKSPSISRHESDSQGETSGDRSGGGEEGGGQRTPQSGTGAAGSQTEADQGGSPGQRRGHGETGSRGGGQVETDGQTGSSRAKQDGPGVEGRQRPGGQRSGKRPDGASDDSAPGEISPQPPGDGRQPGTGGSPPPTGQGQGNSMVGGVPGRQSGAPSARGTAERAGEDPNLEYAREATNLALEHLKDQMDRADSELLGQLGWTPDEARRFVQKWEQMQQAAARQGPEAAAARTRLEQALRSLGLRPRGTQFRGGRTRTDRLRNLREAGRFDPPREWSELFRAYTRGVAAEGRR